METLQNLTKKYIDATFTLSVLLSKFFNLLRSQEGGESIKHLSEYFLDRYKRDVQAPFYEDAELMQQAEQLLNEKMDAAGFTKSRLQFHISLVDYYEKHCLIQDFVLSMDENVSSDSDVDIAYEFNNNTSYLSYISQRRHFICGSYGEGWGCNLSCMDGNVSFDSDVDIAYKSYFDRLYHFKNCTCPDIHVNDVEEIMLIYLGDGHCTRKMDYKPSNSPASSQGFNINQPNRDYVDFQACCIPKSCTLFDDPKLPQDLLDRCKAVGCQIVSAQRPGEEGKEMRISYSLMEREIVRSFPLNIGRCFVFLKFIFKRHLMNFGLKSYMAKSLVIELYKNQVAEDVPVLNLTKMALDLLIENLSCYRSDDPNVCMKHCCQNAAIFFKKDCKPDKQELIKMLRNLTAGNDLLKVFIDFVMGMKTAPNVYYSQYYNLLTIDIYDIVCKPRRPWFESYDYFIENLFDVTRYTSEDTSFCYQTEVTCLKVLQLLKQNKIDDVNNFLTSYIPVKLLKVEDNLNKSELSELFNDHFTRCNSLWSLPINESDLIHLPDVFRKLIIRLDIITAVHKLYRDYDTACTIINFKAVLNYLRYQYTTFTEDMWLQELQQDVFLDFQHIFVFLHCSKQTAHVKWALKTLSCLYCKELNFYMVYFFAETSNNLEHVKWAFETLRSILHCQSSLSDIDWQDILTKFYVKTVKQNTGFSDVWFKHLQISGQKLDFDEVYKFAKTSISLEHLEWALKTLKSLSRDPSDYCKYLSARAKSKEEIIELITAKVELHHLQIPGQNDLAEVYMFAKACKNFEHVEWALKTLKSLSRDLSIQYKFTKSKNEMIQLIIAKVESHLQITKIRYQEQDFEQDFATVYRFVKASNNLEHMELALETLMSIIYSQPLMTITNHLLFFFDIKKTKVTKIYLKIVKQNTMFIDVWFKNLKGLQIPVQNRDLNEIYEFTKVSNSLEHVEWVLETLKSLSCDPCDPLWVQHKINTDKKKVVELCTTKVKSMKT